MLGSSDKEYTIFRGRDFSSLPHPQKNVKKKQIETTAQIKF